MAPRRRKEQAAAAACGGVQDLRFLGYPDGRVEAGLVHINDQTVADEATIPFGGVGASGNGGRLGGPRANLEAFTETQWVTVRGDLPAYPF